MIGTLSLAREPLRWSLVIAEKGFSGAASVARMALEILDEPTPEAGTSGERFRPARREGANGGPPAAEVSVEPEIDVLAPEPGELGPEPDVVEPRAPASAPAREPEHVDEEPVLVAEVAEEGAEDGAGAEVHVDEPWDGYDSMRAADIRARLTDADPEVAGAVKLYELTHKERSSVLEAADRRMRS